MEQQATIDVYKLEKRKIVKKTIGAYLILGIILAILFVISIPIGIWDYTRGEMMDVTRGSTLPDAYTLMIIILPIFSFLAIIIPIYEYWYYRKYFYDVRNDFLVIRKGVITIREVTLNYDKIQDVYMDQDILDRIFSLWDVHVSTATALSGMTAHIDGVNKQSGMAIRELILSKIKRGKSDGRRTNS